MLRNIMQVAKTKARAMVGDESGVTAIEYGLIAGAIAVAIISALLLLGDDISDMFTQTSDALDQAGG